MKDHIETDEERRVRQYEAMSTEQKAMVFQKITSAFGADTTREDPKKLADRAIRAAASAKKPSTKLGHLAQGFRKLSQLRDEATVLFLGLMQAGETPDPDAYWQYHAEITVLMNRLELLADEARNQVEEVSDIPKADSDSSSKTSAAPEIPFPISGYFDIEEAARYTRLSTSTLYHDKTVPCYKAGEKLVFVKDELDTWLRSRRR
ncbi:MAG TPA: helix-turn-helix domain-containing protein [Bacillota bacterium]|nr:helix-turn-helix domain-containing protein [Bacillota bacterium]